MSLTIGQVAQKSGLGLETIRFYERKGLINAPPRTSSGYRQYPESILSRLYFVRSAKQLGFSLGEILELLRLRVDSQTTCDDVKERAIGKIVEIDRKIVALEQMRAALRRLTTQCEGEGPTGDCPILVALEGSGEENA